MVSAPFKIHISKADTQDDQRHQSVFTSKNAKAFPSPAPGAKAMKLAISSSEGNMAG
jgi:hypothetical protein